MAPRLASTSARAAAPEPRALDRVADQPHDTPGQLAGARHLDGGLAAATNVSAISAKFCMCGPNTIGLPCTAGSRMLCPPWSTRLPPTKTTVATWKSVRQLADRVEDDDVGARLGVDGQLRAPHDAEALVAGERLGLAEALRLARRHDEQRRRVHAPDGGERREHGALLALERAGRDEHGP